MDKEKELIIDLIKFLDGSWDKCSKSMQEYLIREVEEYIDKIKEVE